MDAPVPAAPRRKAVRTILPIVIFAIVGVASALLATGLFIYNKAVEPDRSTPTVSVRQMLTAVFIDENSTQAELFVCKDWSADQAIQAMKSQMDPDARVSWGTVETVESSGSRAKVDVRMRFRYPEDVSPSGERRWTFDMVNESGWRVCGAHPAS